MVFDDLTFINATIGSKFIIGDEVVEKRDSSIGARVSDGELRHFEPGCPVLYWGGD